ncbi:nucleotide-diphospho-sugar transferase [Thamnocephalis sphaerospora]|uniref:Translation initiation factor eIF2B subunit epsilon n=1 Tax=Thamnocephalis sphaerospora TaxID=78915 RepID=A0A4P9XGL6_9FUNG|nr:nucleotide-diphospho-sugar transferase [Thamnocephalis sphaerospora]|eukprot:RKP04784.1 nucleotide-diphospho-sugar transferase [Thamnocephalis sphaerospora]
MPPKGASSKALEAEEVLQAVVLADSFDDRFKPLTVDRPRCLLPLCNVPLIEYTLEFLALSGVQRTFVFCQSEAALVRDYLHRCKWGKKNSRMEVQTIVSQECYSIGDAMRELDAKQIIGGDFILVSGDLVANFSLEEALKAHRARKTTDKNAIMTMVLRSASPMHKTRDLSSAALFALDAQSNECVHFETLDAFPRKNQVALDREIFKKHLELDLRNDLIDCQIDICTLEVPALFTENFDYQDIRRDFVHGVLTSDLLDKTIYAHVIEDAYAARATGLRIYDAISKNMLRRWTYPMVPENIAYGDTVFRLTSNGCYKGSNIQMARSCRIGANVMLGDGCVIGENVRIDNAVLGNNCRIGSNTRISGSYLWSGVTVGQDSSVIRSILGDSVSIHDGVIVSAGSVLGSGVRRGDICTRDRVANRLLTPGVGTGITWRGDEDDVDSDDEEVDPRQRAITELASNLAGFDYEEGLTSESSDEESDSDISDIGGEDEFNYEVAQTFERAVEEKHTVEVAALELNTLRMSYNANYHTIRQLLIPVLLRHVDMSAMGPSLKKMMTTWAPLLGRMVHSDKDQVDALFLLQEYCAHSELHRKAFFPTVRYFYELDVVEEDAVVAWYGSPRALSIDKMLRDAVTPFVQWLQEADEEDSDEDSD